MSTDSQSQTATNTDRILNEEEREAFESLRQSDNPGLARFADEFLQLIESKEERS